MIASIQAHQMYQKFSLLKNGEKTAYIASPEIAKEACFIAIDYLKNLSLMSESPFYSSEYWDDVREWIVKNV